MIYLDNAATTKMDERCNKIIEKYNNEIFFNSASPYSNNLNSRIDEARNTFIDMLGGTKNARFIFTPSATISNNIAILGSTAKKQKFFVFAEGEHSSVDSAANFLKANGYSVKFAPLNKDGSLNLEQLEKILDGNVGFVSVMLASNETGAVDHIKKIGEIIKLKCPDAVLHVDAVQGFCKIPMHLKEWGVGLCTIASHKVHGPKGIAGLYIAPNINLKPIFFGGGQEYGLCPGTLNTSGIMAFEFIAKALHSTMQTNYEYVAKLKQSFISNINEIMNEHYNAAALNVWQMCGLKPGSKALSEGTKDNDIQTRNKARRGTLINNNAVTINGDGMPYILSLTIKGIKGAVLVNMLKEQGVLIATGSACISAKAENRALTSMGKNKCEVMGSVRISFSHLNTEKEVQKAAEIFVNSIKQLLSHSK